MYNQTVPPIIAQWVKEMLSKNNNINVRENYRYNLLNVEKYINDSIKEYDKKIRDG